MKNGRFSPATAPELTESESECHCSHSIFFSFVGAGSQQLGNQATRQPGDSASQWSECREPGPGAGVELVLSSLGPSLVGADRGWSEPGCVMGLHGGQPFSEAVAPESESEDHCLSGWQSQRPHSVSPGLLGRRLGGPAIWQSEGQGQEPVLERSERSEHV
ncbi:hypothetical protein NDU88_006249 [Pleurodeles waltl]|uniref:Uncharacterized protein n=1 Tax=Pleurodeles waltl TaxID=8319 RepID=A0AAV7TCU8_PLEWA|nr:hypothetical protein NDU88_006249 [Pleurodeles waltl]